MVKLVRTDSSNPSFRHLVSLLDAEMAARDGDDHAFYAQFNRIDAIRHAIVLFENDEPVGCGAIKPIDANTSRHWSSGQRSFHLHGACWKQEKNNRKRLRFTTARDIG